jgi:hypothetical protein
MKVEIDGTGKGGNTIHNYWEVNEAGYPPGLSELVGISLEFI